MFRRIIPLLLATVAWSGVRTQAQSTVNDEKGVAADTVRSIVYLKDSRFAGRLYQVSPTEWVDATRDAGAVGYRVAAREGSVLSLERFGLNRKSDAGPMMKVDLQSRVVTYAGRPFYEIQSASAERYTPRRSELRGLHFGTTRDVMDGGFTVKSGVWKRWGRSPITRQKFTVKSETETTVILVDDSGEKLELDFSKNTISGNGEWNRILVVNYAPRKPVAEVAKKTEQAALHGLFPRISQEEVQRRIKLTSNGLIRLPLRVHLMTELKMAHPSGRMGCWLKEDAEVQAVVREVNLIWKQANIEWFVESVVRHTPYSVDSSATEYIVNAKRDENGRADRARIPKVYSHFDKSKHHPRMQNLYFFPFIGNTSQGNAGDPYDRANDLSHHAVVGIWSNKYSDGTPYRTEIIERANKGVADSRPQLGNYFEKGSLGRTCAHELGHHLGLGHPNRDTQKEFKRLMGGSDPAYSLTRDEVIRARSAATSRAKAFLRWAEAKKTTHQGSGCAG